jgi:hypothetical protein
VLPADDVGAWIATLCDLIEDHRGRARLGNNVRAAFVAHHTWQQRARYVLQGLDAGE